MRQALRIQSLSIEPKLSPKNDPINVIETARKEMNRADYDHIWCIFDSDTLSKHSYQKACKKARDLGVHIADSLPCFEVWFLLHFGFSSKQYEKCSQVIEDLRIHVHGYSKNQEWLKQKNMFITYQEKISDAIKNAKLIKQFSKDNQIFSGITCEIYKIFEEIERLHGKKLFKA